MIKRFKCDIPDAYEILIKEGMKGHMNMFVGLDEILASWELFTPVLDAWQAQTAPNFPNYAAGTSGPQAANSILEAGHHWHIVN